MGRLWLGPAQDLASGECIVGNDYIPCRSGWCQLDQSAPHVMVPWFLDRVFPILWGEFATGILPEADTVLIVAAFMHPDLESKVALEHCEPVPRGVGTDVL